MAAITAKMVNELRAKTGAGMMECKKALVETEGNFDEAIKVLREKGLQGLFQHLARLLQRQTIFTEKSVCLALAVAHRHAVLHQPVAHVGTEGQKQAAGAFSKYQACRIYG